MLITINFFNVHPFPSNHRGMVCYTRKTHFPRGGNRSPGRAPAARALVRRGFPRQTRATVREGIVEGFPSEEGLSSPFRLPRFVFSEANYFPSPPGKERVSSGTRGSAQYNDRQRRGKLYCFQRILLAARTTRRTTQGGPRSEVARAEPAETALFVARGGFYGGWSLAEDGEMNARHVRWMKPGSRDRMPQYGLRAAGVPPL